MMRVLLANSVAMTSPDLAKFIWLSGNGRLLRGKFVSPGQDVVDARLTYSVSEGHL